MSKRIKLQVMDSGRVGEMVRTFYTSQERRTFDPLARAMDFEMHEEVHPVHEFALSTQTIRVAFDEQNMTLHLGESLRPGWLLAEARRAAAVGSLPSWMTAAVCQADYEADEARGQKARHEQLAATAARMVKSRKSGERRRGKRLLAKLGSR